MSETTGAAEGARLKDEGNKAMQLGDVDKAIELYSLAINVDEENAILYSNRSAAYAKKGQWSEAYGDGTKCVYLKPDFAKGYLRKGVAAQNLGKIQEAKFAFQKGLQLEPTDQQMKQGLAQVNQMEMVAKAKEYAEADERKKKEEIEAIERKKREQEQEIKDAVIIEELKKLSIKEIKGILTERNVDMSDCIEKGDMVKKIMANGGYVVPVAVVVEPAVIQADSTEVKTETNPDISTKTGKKLPQSPREKEAGQANLESPKGEGEKPKDGDATPSAADAEAEAQKKENEAHGIVGDDVDYYKLLGIEKTATPSEIKKAYYKAAKDCHPDKTDDPRAEEMFKLVSEAYNILMDEEKRKIYDKHGRKAVMEMGSGNMDPTMMIRMMFGGDVFEDLIGELSLIHMMSMDEEMGKAKTEEELMLMVEIKELEKVAHIEKNILAKISAYLEGEDKGFVSQAQDINDKLEAPGGIAILAAIGWVFCSESKKNLGRFLGIEAKIAGFQETKHDIATTISLVSSAVKLQQAHERSEKNGGASEQDEAAMMSHGLDTMWKIGKQEIEKSVRAACKNILRDKATRKKRAQALKDLGDIYQKQAARVKKEKGMEKGTFFDFVQKAQEEDRTAEADQTTTNTTSTTSTTSTTGTTGTEKATSAKSKTSPSSGKK
jgi:curved DNA-binding protein CbpA